MGNDRESEDALISAIIAEIARTHGIAISKEDPLITTVLLNRVVLESYLKQSIPLIMDQIKSDMQEATDRLESTGGQIIENIREQVAYVDDVMFKDRERFVEEQKRSLQTLKEWIASRDQAMQETSLRMIVEVQERVEQKYMEEEGRRQKEHREVYSRKVLYVGLAGGIGFLFGVAVMIAGMSISY